MLRITGLSLLLGCAACVALLYIVYLPAGTDQPGVVDLHWAPASGALPGATPESARRVTLTRNGAAIVDFSHAPFAAADYAYLHLSLREFGSPTRIVLAWKPSAAGAEPSSYTIETTERDSLWIATGELRGWEGTIANMGLFIVGQPEHTVRLDAFSLYRPALEYQLRALYSDLAAFVPWNRSSMNSHTGVRHVASFYPAPLFAGLLLACVAAYLVLCIALRSVRFQWQVIGLIVLGVWIALDMFWQHRLVTQAAETRKTFASKSTPEKLAVGPDAQLYAFIAAARAHITEANARVFSASSDDYTGLRGAYYLYPLNVFWSLEGPEIPKSHFLRSGDYIVFLNPYTAQFDPAAGLLTLPRRQLRVETLVTRPAGTLVRVN